MENLNKIYRNSKSDVIYSCINLQDHIDYYLKLDLDLETKLATKSDEFDLEILELEANKLTEFKIIQGYLELLKESSIRCYHCLGMKAIIEELPLGLFLQTVYNKLEKLVFLFIMYSESKENINELDTVYFANEIVLLILELF